MILQKHLASEVFKPLVNVHDPWPYSKTGTTSDLNLNLCPPAQIVTVTC